MKNGEDEFVKNKKRTRKDDVISIFGLFKFGTLGIIGCGVNTKTVILKPVRKKTPLNLIGKRFRLLKIVNKYRLEITSSYIKSKLRG